MSALPIVLPPAAVERDIVDIAKEMNAKIRAHVDIVRAAQTLRELLLPRLLAGDPVPPSRNPGPEGARPDLGSVLRDKLSDNGPG